MSENTEIKLTATEKRKIYMKEYLKNKMLNDPEFRKKQYERASKYKKNQYQNNTEYREKVKQHSKEIARKYKEGYLKYIELTENKIE